MGFLRPPPMPAPPPPVKPLPEMPDATIEENVEAQEAMEEEKKLAKKKKGNASTILTSQQGLLDDANIVTPTLLG